MAAKNSNKPKNKTVAKKGAKSGGIAWPVRIAVFLILVCAAVFAASTLIFFVCMMPTFVAMVIDKQPQKTLWLTVGSMNLAGTVPAWFRLWEAGGTMADSLGMLSNPGALLIAYGAAGAGWMIHMNVTPVVAAMAIKRGENRLRDIEKRQRELIRKWGDGVARTQE